MRLLYEDNRESETSHSIFEVMKVKWRSATAEFELSDVDESSGYIYCGNYGDPGTYYGDDYVSGDSRTGYQEIAGVKSRMRGVISFSDALLPDGYTITSATLKITGVSYQGSTGNWVLNVYTNLIIEDAEDMWDAGDAAGSFDGELQPATIEHAIPAENLANLFTDGVATIRLEDSDEAGERFEWTKIHRWDIDHDSTVLEVTVSADPAASVDKTNRRDVYVCARKDGNTTCDIYVLGTMAAALALPDPVTDLAASDVLAYSEGVSLTGSKQEVTLENVAGTDPDLAGMSLDVSGAGDSGSWEAFYGYIAAPAELILDEFDTILAERMGDGQALSDMDSSRVIKTAVSAGAILSKAPRFAMSSTEDEDNPRPAGDFGLLCRAEIEVANAGLYDRGEENYKELMRMAGNVRSIIGDEEITLNGVVAETRVPAVTGPYMLEDDRGAYLACVVETECLVPVMESDA